LDIVSDRTGLKVSGDSWNGEGNFDGEKGSYTWKFDDGRTGTTEISLDETGILHGTVQQRPGPGRNKIDWTYWATRKGE